MNKKGFAPLAVLAIIGLSLLTGYLGSKINSPKTLGAYNTTAGGNYRLKTTAAPTDTTIHLSSFKEPISNIPYTMGYLGSNIEYGTLDPQQPTRSEFISYTGITQNSDGSADLTGVLRGLARSPGANASGCTTASTTLEQAHSGQSIFISTSDSPCHFLQYAVKQNDETITGLWNFASTSLPQEDKFASSTKEKEFVPFKQLIDGFLSLGTTSAQTIAGLKLFTTAPQTSAVPSVGNDITNKTYVDGVAIAGAANASQTTKGIVEEATVAEINAGTVTGGTGAELFINPAQFQYSNFASTTQWYFASSSVGSAYKAKTLTLSAGDLVWFGYSTNNGATNMGKLSYRISAPNSNSTTTIADASSNAGSVPLTLSGFLQATTTETVTFEHQGGDAGSGPFFMWIEVLSGFGFSKYF